MFDEITCNKVLVTGPHRSGTTIASEIIANQLGLKAVRECDIAVPRKPGDTCPYLDMEMASAWMAENDGFSLQGATCFRWVEALQTEDLATVFVVRDTQDVLRSQTNYRGRAIDKPREKHRQWLDMIERSVINQPITIQYEDLHVFPEFHDNRGGWEPRQTKP